MADSTWEACSDTMTGDAIERLLLRHVGLNLGVAAHEFRARIRGRRGRGMLLAWATSLLLAMVFGLWRMHWSVTRCGGSGEANQLGSLPFRSLVITEATLLLLLLPIHAAAAITMEREKRRFDALTASLLSPRQIVTAKLVSLTALAGLCVLIAVPVTGACLLLGGADGRALLWSHTLVLAMVFWATGLGLLFSAVCPATVPAISCTYMVGAVMLTMPPLMGEAAAFYFALLPRGPLRAALEPAAGNILLAMVVAALVAALSFGIVRTVLLWRGMPEPMARRLSIAAAAVLAGVVLIAATRHFIACAGSEPRWLVLCCPWVALGNALDEGSALRLSEAFGAGVSPPGSGPSGWTIWGVAMCLTTAAGLLNHELAARLLAWSIKRGV